MSYCWVITKDHIDNGEAVGTYGPRGCKLTPEEIKKHPKRKHFKMRDDDNELYYEGYLVGDAQSEDGFAPLEDFGMPNAGCTGIWYRNADGVYEVL